MIKNKYRYTLSVEFEAFDDPESRDYAQCISLNVSNVLNSICESGKLEKTEKLQMIYSDKAPRKVELK